jgi:hypothetical protein
MSASFSFVISQFRFVCMPAEQLVSDVVFVIVALAVVALAVVVHVALVVVVAVFVVVDVFVFVVIVIFGICEFVAVTWNLSTQTTNKVMYNT